MKGLRAVVFDFDGLMVDTETCAYETWRAIHDEFGVDLPVSVWQGVIGSGPGEGIDFIARLSGLLGRDLDRKALRAEYDSRNLPCVHAAGLLPGVADRIEEAAALGLRLGVASSSPSSWVLGHLERLGLRQRFMCVRCGDQVPRTKPSPDVYLAVLECLGVPPSHALALEDSPRGAEAAAAAGIRLVTVPNAITAPMPFVHEGIRLESLAHLSLAGIAEAWGA